MTIEISGITQWFSERQAFRARHEGISLSGEVDPFCRPQLVYWLVTSSTAEQRKDLLEVLVNVVKHHEVQVRNKMWGGWARNKMWNLRHLGPTKFAAAARLAAPE